ncbi:MAG: site-specific DNA-methyltransferase [Sulfurovum sp.]|nr:site-specific DNA-methyltransferase [Sulfurovum sp.]
MTTTNDSVYTTGDCIQVLSTADANSVDLCIVDLPYGKTKNAWDCQLDLPGLWFALNRVAKDTAPTVMFATQPFATQLINSNPKNFRYDLIWLKNKTTGHLNAKRMPMRQHELVLVFYKKLPQYSPQMTIDHKPVNNFYTRTSGTTFGESKKQQGGGSTVRYPTSILQFSVVNNSSGLRIHASQKPVALIEYLINTYSQKGDLILDPTAGSGSSAIACINTGRRYLCIEKDRDASKLAAKWISETLKAKANLSKAL